MVCLLRFCYGSAMSDESLTTNLNHQLEQATELRNFAYVVMVAEHKGQFTRAHKLASALFYRSLQTHEATEILIRRPLVEDARVLVRVLVEQVVNCAYMLTVVDDQTVEDFVKYQSVSVELEEDVRKESEARAPRFKNRRNGEWCVDGKLHERAAKVDEKFSEALKKPYIEFRWLVNSEWRFAGSHVHGMADSILEQVSVVEGVTTIEQKFDVEDAATALYSANFALLLVLPLVDGSLGGKNASEISARARKFTGHE